MDEIFARNVLYWGEDAQNKIASSHIAVFGLGGVGGFCAETIARSGVENLHWLILIRCLNLILTARLLLLILV